MFEKPKPIKKLNNLLSEPNRDAIFVFGMQKAGTSAIAGLLAESTGLSVTIDTEYLWDPYMTKLMEGELSLEDHITSKSHPFSKDIIKEPEATYIIDKVDECFELDKYVYVIRNPYQNIRSILNRLNLPGNKSKVNLSSIPTAWKRLFPSNGNDYIKDLAKLWVKAYNNKEYIESESCVLVKYEDFVEDKETFIEELGNDLDLNSENDISHIVDHQFQPKGNSKCDLHDFFGEKNYKIISGICGSLMRRFDYNLI